MMPFVSVHKILVCLMIISSVFSDKASSVERLDMLENPHGFYAREGNNTSSSGTAGNNIYIKFFQNQWIAMLYVPYPYASSVEPRAINAVFDEAKKQITSSSFIRGKFGHLDEKATLQFERYGYLDDQIVFECGALSPCTIKMSDGYLELIKPGVINEHIIKYNHFAAQ